MDLHTWITQQVDETERVALAARTDIAGLLASGDIDNRIAERHIGANDPVAVLRRCEADRRILAIHCSEGVGYSAACGGCGTEGDCDDWISENLNDCPILLALVHTHGITVDVLAGLNRPQQPRPAPRSERRLGLGDILTATNPITTSDTPEALRGPHWKP